MKKFFARHGKKLVVLGGACMCAVASALPALAVPVVDYTAIGTAITAELTPALAAVVPITGTIIAVGVGIHMVKKFTGK